MIRPIAALVVLSTLAGTRASAETAPGPLRLTLAEAVDRARQASPRLDQLRSLQQAADAALSGARAGRQPYLDITGSYTLNSNVPQFVVAPAVGPATVLFPNIPNNYDARVGLTLPVYTGGGTKARITQTTHERHAAGRDLEAGASDLVLETTTSYWSLVSALESARVLRESIASYDADLKQVQDRFDVGLAARNDVLNVQVERDRAELSRLSAANGAAVANLTLVKLLGLPAGSAIDPAEPVAAPAAVEEDVEGLVARATSGRPEIASLRSRADAAEAAVEVARAGTRPQASLTAGYGYARPYMRIIPPSDKWADFWSVGAKVSIQAFDGGRAQAAAAEARARAEGLRHQIDELLLEVRLDVTSRVLDLSTRRAELEVAERSLLAARENVRVSQDRYREGLIPSSELLDAESRLLRAGLDRTTSATLVQQARASLDHAVGR